MPGLRKITRVNSQSIVPICKDDAIQMAPSSLPHYQIKCLPFTRALSLPLYISCQVNHFCSELMFKFTFVKLFWNCKSFMLFVNEKIQMKIFSIIYLFLGFWRWKWHFWHAKRIIDSNWNMQKEIIHHIFQSNRFLTPVKQSWKTK